MKIGISSASLYPMETELALKTLGEYGVSVTELFFNSPSELKQPFIMELDRIRRFYGTEINSLHPSGSVGEPYYLFSGYLRRYRDAFEYYKQYYYAASVLGAKTVLGIAPKTERKAPGKRYGCHEMRQPKEPRIKLLRASVVDTDLATRMLRHKTDRQIDVGQIGKCRWVVKVRRCIHRLTDKRSAHRMAHGRRLIQRKSTTERGEPRKKGTYNG